MKGKDEVLALLARAGIAFDCEHHEPVFNMMESDTLVLSLQGARCKNLVLKDKGGRFFLVMTTGGKSLDLSEAAVALGSKRLSFASAENLQALLGVVPGSVSPLALVNDPAGQVRLVIDAELAGEAVFLLHPLDNSATVALSRENLEAFLRSIDHAPAWLALKARAAA
ncbi:prolyl-tRNA synthetase associated domain-containing protein [Burkholderia gladioli]|uniref:prolyl-tRNA synthetase associated domain-containing protein n=1 Tax=Burkholderia gladioli TaxID=28095 RepID=UPI001640BAEE|nr:prolyl-tRNA synthetase associated domain-containing protein [Burkholderia gladioli]